MENVYGAWITYKSIGGNVERGQVVTVMADGRLEVMRFLDNGSFGGLTYIEKSAIVEVLQEGDSKQNVDILFKRTSFLDNAR